MSHPIARPKYLSVTDTHLLCSGLPDMSADVADAIRTWLHDHGLDEHKILANLPIIRHPETHQVEWTEGGGKFPTQRFTTVGEVAPFPQLLLEQRKPEACPTCGHVRGEEEARR